MRPAKIAAIVGGVLLVLIGLALLLPGGFLLWLHGTQRDSDGFYTTPSRVLTTNAYALTTPDVDLGSEPWTWVWLPKGDAAAVRIQAESTGDAALFIGIGPTDRIAEYLSGVAHDEVKVTGSAPWHASVEYRRIDGEAPRSAPAQQDFWVATAEGSGSQTLDWPVQAGRWTAVMMNVDGTAQLTAAVTLGARFGALVYIAIGITVGGVVLLAVGILLIVLGARRRRTEPPAGPALLATSPPSQPTSMPAAQDPQAPVAPMAPMAPQSPQTPPSSAYSAFPLTFTVDYPDRPLNRLSSFFRCLWLIPIGIIAGLVASGTISAHGMDYSWSWGVGGLLFAPVLLMLLFRRKYPRWWFDWNLNLTRFLMRVTVYGQLLRDEYPSTDEEQAVHLDFPYPDAQQLSQGLPLIKWFLAIPHWIVLFFLWIGAVVSVIIAWFAILFTGRYPRGLFDYVVGVNRWSLRVNAYAILLITDEYPPFSLAE
jgi:hypothetical protein